MTGLSNIIRVIILNIVDFFLNGKYEGRRKYICKNDKNSV